MVALRTRPKEAALASFGLASLVYVLTPTHIGYQDLAALMGQQPAVAARWRQHLIASPFGTIHAATFSLPRPLGTLIPEPPTFRLASIDRNGDVTGSIGANPFASRPETAAPIVFPIINRTSKGDRLVPSRPTPQAAPEQPATPAPASVPAAPAVKPGKIRAAETEDIREEDTWEGFPELQDDILAAIARDATPVTDAPRRDEIEAAGRLTSFPEYDISLSLELDPQIPPEELGDLADLDPTQLYPNAPPSLEGLNDAVKDARLFFGSSPFGHSVGAMTPWATGEEPVLMVTRGADPDIKQASPALANAVPGVTIAGKGEVTGVDRRPKTPAERLGLSGGKRAKAEKCLANAVYFEARSEPVRGQIAVAQVVMNRAFSGFYPSDVCGVVYQNANRHLACQFTFACDGIPDIVNDPESWARATRIAKETLDGKLWLADVGKSTHYHASYVRPWWVRAMSRTSKIGLHNFYRPRKWGDGSDAPSWGSVSYTAELAAKI
jgi:Cell Wall Hydrolase